MRAFALILVHFFGHATAAREDSMIVVAWVEVRVGVVDDVVVTIIVVVVLLRPFVSEMRQILAVSLVQFQRHRNMFADSSVDSMSLQDSYQNKPWP